MQRRDVEALGFELSEQVVEAVEADEAVMGILPVENSIVGNVAVNTDLFFSHDIFAIGEVFLPIHHCLLARPGGKIEDIKSVHSHPIALAQCRDFINRHNMRSIPDFDTAGACKLLIDRNSLDQGTIASKLCKEYYDVEILDDDVQKVQHNITRFLIFVKSSEVPSTLNKEKTSLAFTTKHHPGALLNSLQKFAKNDINLTKLESRPIPENPFAYTFFVDFLGSTESQSVIQCLDDLSQDAKDIKILGCYPAGEKAH